MSDYYYELKNLFDLEELKKIALPYITEEWKQTDDFMGLISFTDKTLIKVADHDYLLQFQQRFPRLGNTLRILKNSNKSWPVHLDVNRLVSINIPIMNTGEGKITRFYEGGTQVNEWYGNFGIIEGSFQSNEYQTYVQDATPVLDYVLDKNPAIINTTKPHSVYNQHANPTDPNPRFIMAWGYTGTYEEAVEVLGNGTR